MIHSINGETMNKTLTKPEKIEAKIEAKIKKNIENLAKEYAYLGKGSARSEKEIIESNKKELESFFLDNSGPNEAINFTLNLLGRLGFQLFDEDSVALMDRCSEKLKQKKKDTSDTFALREMFGIKAEKLEQVYKIANSLFEGKYYESAKQLYLFIITLDSSLTNSWIGLALCLEKLNQIENAFKILLLLTVMHPTPDAYIYAIDCCLKIPNMQEAKGLMHQLEQLDCSEQQKAAIKELKSQLN